MGEFHKLRTFHGSLVAEDRTSGEVASFAETDIGPDNPALIAYVSDVRPTSCFLIAEEPTILRVVPTLEGVSILPLGLARNGTSIVSLYDPDTGLWVCATPLAGNTQPPRGRLASARRRINDYERLTLVPLLPIFVPSATVEIAARLEAMLSRPVDLDLIQTARPEDAAILQAVARNAPLWQLEALAETLLKSPEGCRALERLFPKDIMGRHGLPVLAEWVARRAATASPRARLAEPATRRMLTRLFAGATPPPPESAKVPGSISEQVLGPELDDLSSPKASLNCTFLPYTLTALARRAVTPRQDLCIIATARNEGLYILEWIAYHRAIGVQAMFLYTNDNDDGSDALLSALARGGALYWARNQVAVGGNAQSKAYGHALGLRPEVLDYRWALIIDLDEYLVLNPSLFHSAIDFLRWHEGSSYDAIALNWVFHGSGGQARWREDFIAKRFPHPAGGANNHIKTLCQPRRFIHSTPHFPLTLRDLPFQLHAASGEPYLQHKDSHNLALSANPNADFAWINHYFFKSSEEFLWKWSRNRGDHAMLRHPTNTVLTSHFVRAFMQQFSGKSAARAHPDQSTPNFVDELAQLMALPGVVDAWADVKRIYAERVKSIVPMFVEAPGIIEAGDAGREFLATLGL
jgi:hypothetical protein